MADAKKSERSSLAARRAQRVTWPPVLTAIDIAELLGLQNERAARAFVARHGIPYVKAGRTLLVLLESLVEWLKEQETRGDARGEALLAAANKLSLDQQERRDRTMARIARRRN